MANPQPDEFTRISNELYTAIMQTDFTLDEGLGACDQANRLAVMQAIQAVAQEFGKVLVITHIAELQDALPQRIEVTKGPDGSKVRIV